MSENLRKDQDKKNIDNIRSLWQEWSDLDTEEEEFRSEFFQGLSGRRKKAAFSLFLISSVTIGIHLVSWGSLIILAIAIMVTLQTARLMLVKVQPKTEILSNDLLESAPIVSILVAAKNEEAVIGKLVKILFEVDYPLPKYEVFIIDDSSTDNTGIILDKLATQYENLTIIHREKNATGGKSGALNQILPLTKGEIIGVFDADAVISPDLLKQIIPLFDKSNIGAIQVRKAISNYYENFLTQGQTVEMALDGYFQQQRIGCGGIGELRGNGQFVRRTALDSCGGWNEETITDDLDLTIRLHLDGWDIDLLSHPVVEEEGVTNTISLWHQRNRWGEGGYQRYLDYWRFLIGDRLNWQKKFDLLFFFFIQYILPTAAIPDMIMSIARNRFPLIAPLTSLTLTLAFWGMFTGLRRSKINEKITLNQYITMFWQSLSCMVYMIHWFIVIPCVTLRMSIRPKRLKWVKTIHGQSSDDNLGLEISNG